MELGRYLAHSTHVHHIYERKRKWVDYKLEKPGRKNSILSKLIFYELLSKRLSSNINTLHSSVMP